MVQNPILPQGKPSQTAAIIAFSSSKSVAHKKRSALELSAADELDDFVAVAGFNRRLSPGWARKYFEVALDGNAA
jgi:hypothetical protein